ncbi:Arm DNA-binding domain-containing protein [Rhizobium leguminosarum]
MGSYLYVSTAGGKSWRLDYAYFGKRKTVTLGTYRASGP